MNRLGIAETSYMISWRPQDTLEFLRHCQQLGAGGIQAYINGDPTRIGTEAERHGMYIEAMVRMPDGENTAKFEDALQKAEAVGAVALRTDLLPTRRYETFGSLQDWEAHIERCYRSIEAAQPLLDRYKIPLGLENHKDWTADQLVEIMQRYGTEYLGVTLDFGNNISLLDDPMEAIEKLAPYTVCTHLKDMAVASYDRGFLLSEVPLGQGYLDLPQAIDIVRKARPKANFCLEMISRDPLQVPCLTDRYWATFPDRCGIDLARTLRFVQQHQSRSPLPTISQLSPEQQLQNENENVVGCLQYAKQNLGL